MDSNVHNQPSVSYVPKCHYCGRFIGKNDNWESKRIYGHFSPDCDIFFHSECRDNHYESIQLKDKSGKFYFQK